MDFEIESDKQGDGYQKIESDKQGDGYRDRV